MVGKWSSRWTPTWEQGGLVIRLSHGPYEASYDF